MQRNPQSHPPFWMIGIATVSVVVIALLIRGIGMSLIATPMLTPSPVRLELEDLPIMETTSISKTPTLTSTPALSPLVTPIPPRKGPGKILYVSDQDGNEEIYVMDLDGKNKTRLTQNPGRDIDPQWSPDGTRIAFLSERENGSGLYVMASVGSQQTLLTLSVVVGEGEFSWSPNSNRLAYSSLTDGRPDISIINVDGSLKQNLTATGTEEERSPSWSPDGAKIAFYSTDLKQYYTMNFDGSDRRKVADSPKGPWRQPQWSPDGLNLLVSISDEIFSVHTKTDAITQLTANLNYDAFPAASPDGTRIAFVSSRDQGSHEIFTMSPNGGRAEKISNIFDARASISKVIWSPDGSKIIYTISNYRGGTTAEIFSIDLNTRETSNLTQDPSFSFYLSDVGP